jgi:hypothetical protein
MFPLFILYIFGMQYVVRQVCWKSTVFNQQRWPLRGNSTVKHFSKTTRSRDHDRACMQRRNTSRSRLRWRHATIGELRVAALPRGTATGGQCRYNGTRNSSPTSTEELCCWVRAVATSGESRGKPIFSSDRTRTARFRLKKKIWSWVQRVLTPRWNDRQ